jgi:hypothetical protein
MLVPLTWLRLYQTELLQRRPLVDLRFVPLEYVDLPLLAGLPALRVAFGFGGAQADAGLYLERFQPQLFLLRSVRGFLHLQGLARTYSFQSCW